jgi:hypothetical protein
VLVIMNPTNQILDFQFEKYSEITGDETSGYEVISKTKVDLSTIKGLAPNSIKIIELR